MLESENPKLPPVKRLEALFREINEVYLCVDEELNRMTEADVKDMAEELEYEFNQVEVKPS